MGIFGSLQWIVYLLLSLVVFGTQLFALVDALRRPASAFTAEGKLSKPIWLAILGVAAALGFLSIPSAAGSTSASSGSSRSSRRSCTSSTCARASSRTGTGAATGRPAGRAAGERRGDRRRPHRVARAAVPLAEVVRGDLVESVHTGHLVLLDADGGTLLERGDAGTVIWPRSSVKPFQAVAMLRHGLRLPPRLRALAAASHDGEPEHLAGVREILAGAGLDESALRNTPDLPLHPPAALAWQEAGTARRRSPRTAPASTRRCSRRASWRAGTRARTWSTTTRCRSRSGRPSRRRRASRSSTSRSTAAGRRSSRRPCAGSRAPSGGSPRPRSTTRFPRGRGRARHGGVPEMVGGTGRDATLAMRAVPGLVARTTGRRGVRGRAARRPCARPQGARRRVPTPAGGARRRAASSRRARRRGADGPALDALGDVPVLGAGQPVGTVRAVLDEAAADALQDRPHGPSADTARHADGVGREGRRPARDARERARRGRRRDGGGRRRDRPTGPPRARRRHARRRRRAGGDDRAQDRRAADPRGERSVLDDGAPVLVVSQFTLYADTRRADARRGTARRPVPSPSRSSTRSSTRCAPAGSRSRPDGSARTWRSTSSTTARSR